MTKPRPWPNNAAEARDRAAEELQQAARALRPLVRGHRFDSTETLRRQAVALESVLTALRHLESVGAQTRPE
jgi:hypothetical protein